MKIFNLRLFLDWLKSLAKICNIKTFEKKKNGKRLGKMYTAKIDKLSRTESIYGFGLIAIMIIITDVIPVITTIEYFLTHIFYAICMLNIFKKNM
ncbi:MAG: hypothetical protein LBF68_05645 [Christensenellaceae bacterium]|nr:hypothetical protein [Christensenellaceae bacterium]